MIDFIMTVVNDYYNNGSKNRSDLIELIQLHI